VKARVVPLNRLQQFPFHIFKLHGHFLVRFAFVTDMGMNYSTSFSCTVKVICMRKKWVLTTGADERELGPDKHNTPAISCRTDWSVYCLGTQPTALMLVYDYHF
jgi:hypothetical protein